MPNKARLPLPEVADNAAGNGPNTDFGRDRAAMSAVPGWPAIVARSLSKRFGSQVAVESLDLDIPVGSFCGLVGPNGSGKTTALRMITGLLRPDYGQAWIVGHDTWAEPVTVKQLLGVVPDPLNLFERLTAKELMVHLGAIRQMPADVVEHRSKELLDVMDLGDSVDKQIGGYSHGMRKKTAIAAALLHRPKVLVLDEPFEGVDPVSVLAVRSVLDRYRAAGGTVVFSSHTMELVDKMCDYVAVMSKGRLLSSGSTAQLRGAGTLEEAFIALIGAAPVDSTTLSWLSGDGDYTSGPSDDPRSGF